MATKAEKEAAKAVKQAEKAEIAQVKAAQEAEKIALKSQGASKDIIKAEQKANATELANAKATLAAAGQQTLLSQGQNTFLSGASAYSGDLAAQVNAILANAANKYDTLGITNVSKSGDTTIGLGLDKLVKYDLGEAGNQVTKTVERAQQFVGQSFTPAELAAQGVKIKPVKGVDGLFQYKTGSAGNNVYTFFRQDENGNLVGTGVNRTSTPQADGGFFSSPIGQILAIGGTVALALTPGGQAFAAQVGSALSGGALSGLSAQALGQAAIRGVSTGVITGDVEKGLIAGALSGAGSALNLSGTMGQIFDSVGLGDYKDAFGVISAPGVGATGAFDIGGAAGTGLMDYTDLVSAGIPVTPGTAQVTPITGGAVTPTAVTPTGAFDMGGATGAGLLTGDSAALYNQLQQAGLLTETGAFDIGGAAGTGLTGAAPITTLPIPPNQPGYVEPGLGSSLGNLGQAVVGSLMSGAGVAAVASQLGLSTGQVQDIANALGLGGGAGAGAGQGGAGNMFGNLINAGIDYATASKIARDLESQAQSLSQRAEAAGRAAQTPFTPYTLTTGTGTTTLGPTGATSLLSPELQALQQQQIGLAGQTLGAINPAQAAQTLFNQAEALAAPSRQREQERLLGSLGARGLLGIGRNLPTVGGGVAGVNPYLESLLSAQETARAQQALTAQQAGTQEAIRQQQLAAGFQTGALGLDTQALNQLAQARGLTQDQINLAVRNAEAQRLASLEGLRLAAPLYTAAGNVRAGQTSAIGQQTQGLFDYIFK
jgi:hypothetical protein